MTPQINLGAFYRGSLRDTLRAEKIPYIEERGFFESRFLFPDITDYQKRFLGNWLYHAKRAAQ